MFSLIFLARCLLALLFLNASNAIPLANRQATTSAQLSAPTTVMTVTSSMTPAGPLTQTCVITLTPIKDSNGNAAVQEVKNCTVAMNASSNSTSASSTSSNNNSTSSSISSNSSSSDSNSATSSSDSNSATSSDSNSATSTSTAAASSVSIPGNGAISANGVTTETALTPSTPSAGASTAASSAVSTTPSPTDGASGSASSASATTATSSSASAAADNSNPSASSLASNGQQQLAEQTYVVPGKSLQVLPIGLGVFAGISALALIVVGLVTYERTKYRKAFRQRKLAEQGAAMGYSR